LKGYISFFTLTKGTAEPFFKFQYHQLNFHLCHFVGLPCKNPSKK